MRSVAKWTDGILDRIFSVVGAVAFSQFPEFVHQYVQRLGGHADEAQRQVTLIQDAARLSGKTLDEYIAHFMAQSNPDFVGQAQLLEETLHRAAELRGALHAIQNASVFTKPFVFLGNMDVGIAKRALSNFQPAVPLSLESLIYAALGIMISLVLYHLVLKSPFRLVHNWMDRRRLTTLKPRARDYPMPKPSRISEGGEKP